MDRIAVQKNSRLPEVCIKCGRQDALVRTVHTFQWVPPWVWGAVLGAIASVIATRTSWTIPLLALSLVLIWVTRKSGQVDLALCRSCSRAGYWATVWAGFSVVAALVGTFFSILMIISGLLWGGIPLLTISLALPLGVYLLVTRPRILLVGKVDEQSVVLVGVHRTARTLIARGATAY